MPNWCRDKLTITGPEADRAAFLTRAGDTLDFNVWKPYPEDYRKLDEATREWENLNLDKDTHEPLNGAKWEERPKDGFNQGGYEWCIENWNSKWNASPLDGIEAPTFCANNDRIICTFETPFSPPLAIINLMSQEFPALTFALEYSVEGMWDAGRWEFADGIGFLREHEVGWFRTAKDDEPIHHYVSRFNIDDAKVQELISARILFRPETARCSDEFAFRCAPAELGVLYGHPSSWTLRYTLDEDIYLESCYSRAGRAAVFGGWVNEGGALLCNCSITLSRNEIDWLRATVIPYNERELDLLSECPDHEARLVAYRSQERQTRQSIFEQYGAQHSYPTTRKELSILLTCLDLPGERRKEIEAAMLDPRWKSVWPQWRMITEVPAQPSTESVDHDFMAELGSL